MSTFSDLNIIYTNNGVAIYKYSNFKHYANNQKNANSYLEGDWFIVDGDIDTYSHFMYDTIGQFYAIKSIVPSLKPLILIPDAITSNNRDPDFLWWCIDKLLLEPGAAAIPFQYDLSFVIENLYIASTDMIHFFNSVDVIKSHLTSHDEYQDFVLPELRKFFLANLSIDNTPSKIYMSRRSKSAQLRLEKEYIEYLKDNKVSWDSAGYEDDRIVLGKVSDPNNVIHRESLPNRFKYLVSWDAHPAYIELEVNTRYMSEVDELKLETFFEKAGYKILVHDNLSYEEQMSAIANASHFATFTGSAVINSVVCRDNASIYVLNQNTMSNRSTNIEYLPGVLFSDSHSVFSYKDRPGKYFL